MGQVDHNRVKITVSLVAMIKNDRVGSSKGLPLQEKTLKNGVKMVIINFVRTLGYSQRLIANKQTLNQKR